MNKEENSLCKIVKNDIEINLTEKELEDLISQIYKYRPDAFFMVEDYKIEIESLNEEIKNLEAEITNLREEIDILEEN